MPTLAEIADELYGLLPAEFTAARNVWVRALKDETDTELAERVSVLRKASPAAWGVNLLARHRSDELAQLADLGALMRQAQSDLDRDQLAELTSQRRRLVSALAREAAELAADAHHVLTSSALDEVAATLQAALGDPAAAAAVMWAPPRSRSLRDGRRREPRRTPLRGRHRNVPRSGAASPPCASMSR